MPALDSALYHLVSQAPDLLPLVNGRVFPLLAPQQAPVPFIVYSEISYFAAHHMGGVTRLAATDVQWDVYGDRHQQAREVGEALTTLLDGYRGLTNGVDIRATFVRARRTTLEDDQAGGQVLYYRVSLDTEIWHLL